MLVCLVALAGCDGSRHGAATSTTSTAPVADATSVVAETTTTTFDCTPSVTVIVRRPGVVEKSGTSWCLSDVRGP